MQKTFCDRCNEMIESHHDRYKMVLNGVEYDLCNDCRKDISDAMKIQEKEVANADNR